MPSSFVTPLEYEAIPGKFREDRQVFKITAPFVYDIGHLGSGVSIEVKAGYETDFASIPKRLDDLFGFDPTGRHNKAVVLHDFLYSFPGLSEVLAYRIFIEERAALKVNGINVGRWYGKARPRFFADLVMLEAAEVSKVDIFNRHIHFLAVRFGGRKAFARASALNQQTQSNS